MKFEDYVKISSELKDLNEQLCDFIVQTSQKTKKSSPIIKRADKTMKDLSASVSKWERIKVDEYNVD